MISPETIDKVKDLAIVNVVEKYHETPKKQGANYVCHCPWHKDKHPSFMVSPAKNIAKCFVCDKAVNGISFVMETKNIGYPEAIRTIANDFGIKITETYKKEATDEEREKYKELEALVNANSWAADWYHNQLLAALEKWFPDNQLFDYSLIESGDFALKGENREAEINELKAVHYIFRRMKGSLELVKKFKIGYAPAGFNNLFNASKSAGFSSELLSKAGLIKQNDNGFMDCFIFRPFIFPVNSIRGNIVGFSARKLPWDKSTDKNGKPYPKFINTSETAIYQKGSLLYGFDYETQGAIRKADKVYVVEGNTDKTTLFHINIKNVVAKSGTALTDGQIDNVKKLTKNICLVDDGDNAGQLSMQKNGEKLTFSACNVTVLTLTDGQDPDSFFQTEEQFREFEKENERDYIIDIRAIEELEGASTIQLKKKVKQAVAELLLQKPKEDRDEYIQEIIKGSDTTQKDWNQAIKAAAFSVRNKGLNIAEETEDVKIEPDNSSENFKRHDFYYVKTDRAGNPTGIEFNELRFQEKLKSTKDWELEHEGRTKHIYFGFYTYSISSDEEDTMFVQLQHGKIKKVSINYIRRIFFQYVRLLKPIEYENYNNEGKPWTKLVTSRDIQTALLKKVTTLFDANKLVIFPDKEIRLLQDCIDKHYTFFRNCYVISTKNGYTIHEYEQLKDGYVWDDAVLDREFNEPKDNEPGMFEKFVHDISGNEWDLARNQSFYPEKIRYKSLLISGGYMLHNYPDMQRKAVILTQGRISEDDSAEGREGKTLFIEAIGRNMLNKEPDESKTYVYVPGKDLKSDDKHKWQDLELNTTCVLYDDPPPWISFEDLYNVAERAFKVEKKRMENMYVKARIFITTNRPLDRDSGSSRARSCVIELDSIFHADFTPVDKYGHYFFRDWKEDLADEWNKFSKYVLGKMLPEYFRANCRLLEPPSKNLYRNELLQKARRLSGSMEIVFWLDYLTRGDEFHEPHFKISETYTTKELYDKLLQDRDMRDNKKLKNNFTKIVKSYLDKEGITYEQNRVASGTEFRLLSGLPDKIIVNQQFVKDFFSNGDNYDVLDVQDDFMCGEMCKRFNEKYNTSITSGIFRKAVEEMNEEVPFI